MILAEGLSKRFKGRVAIEALSLSAARGEIFGLIGPDGAGKSTTMRILAGTLDPDAGRAEIGGYDLVRDRARVKNLIGYMPQGFALYPELTVDENIDYFAELRDVPPEQRETVKRELLSVTRLDRAKGRLAGSLSGGMKQKLALCCAVIHSPPALLLDEPTTGIDPLSRRDLWIILSRWIVEKGMTVLLSTSYLEEAERCHQVALMHEGKIIASGPPDRLRAMFEAKILEVSAQPQRRALEALARLPGVVRAEIFGEKIRVWSERGLDDKLHSYLKDLGIELLLLRPAEPSLEDLFLSLLPARAASEPDAARAAAAYGFAQPAAAGEQPILVRDLVKRYGDVTAVAGISFEVKRGEIFGLLGPNGAGKTTAIKMLCGILPPSAGRAEIAGHDISREPYAVRARIGYLAQRFSLYNDLTVSENIGLFAGIYGVPRARIEERRRAALAMAGLVGREGERAGDLPLGFKQRLALASALLHGPEILFLDEPTSGLDPAARRAMWELIYGLSREKNVTVVISTHYMDEAERCDRLGLMHMGKLVAVGSPDELKRAAERALGRAIEIECRNPIEALRRAAPLLETLAQAGLHGSKLRFFSRRPEQDTARMAAALRDEAVSIETAPPNMEDAFIYHIDREAKG